MDALSRSSGSMTPDKAAVRQGIALAILMLILLIIYVVAP